MASRGMLPKGEKDEGHSRRVWASSSRATRTMVGIVEWRPRWKGEGPQTCPWWWWWWCVTFLLRCTRRLCSGVGEGRPVRDCSYRAVGGVARPPPWQETVTTVLPGDLASLPGSMRVAKKRWAGGRSGAFPSWNAATKLPPPFLLPLLLLLAQRTRTRTRRRRRTRPRCDESACDSNRWTKKRGVSSV